MTCAYVWKLSVFRYYFLQFLQTLILVNNKISKISPEAFKPLVKLERLYLSKNQLKELPEKMPRTLQELRVHENEITKLRKSMFNGLNNMIVIGTDLIIIEDQDLGDMIRFQGSLTSGRARVQVRVLCIRKLCDHRFQGPKKGDKVPVQDYFCLFLDDLAWREDWPFLSR